MQHLQLITILPTPAANQHSRPAVIPLASCIASSMRTLLYAAVIASAHVRCAGVQMNLHITEQQRATDLPDDVAAPSHPRCERRTLPLGLPECPLLRMPVGTGLAQLSTAKAKWILRVGRSVTLQAVLPSGPV